MYSENLKESMKAVEAARDANIAYEPQRMTAQQKEDLIKAYHPDYKTACRVMITDHILCLNIRWNVYFLSVFLCNIIYSSLRTGITCIFHPDQ